MALGQEFEDGIAATGLLPGPASTQLAIYCAWRLRGPAGALIGALCFIVPGLLVILVLSALFLEACPPMVVLGAAAGAGAAVPAVALHAAAGLLPASRRGAGDSGR
jgi:chromate transporter